MQIDESFKPLALIRG